MSKVCFVGITDKIGMKPFDPSTKSGIIIDQIISQLDFDCDKINYVSFSPLSENGKLRYPTKDELTNSFVSFQERISQIQPDLLVVCGKMIAKELQKHNFYQDKVLIIYHPSYVYVYKRNHIDSYVQEVVKQIKEIILL